MFVLRGLTEHCASHSAVEQGTISVVLGQRLDRLERLLAASPLPVREQLVLMHGRPLGHEAERAQWQRAGDHVAREVDRRSVTRVAGVEMRASVRSLVQYIQIVIP